MTATTTKNKMPALSEPHPSLQIFNTLSKRKEPLRTVVPGTVGIYLCGPTVYDKAHIGHMVGPVIFDCMKRYLTYCGYDVTWVVNITDVDDKLINKAAERGISMLEVAEENIADYQSNLTALGVDQVDHFPRATECMDDIIALIRELIDSDYAYAAEGDVYFDVSQDPDYGKLSNRKVDELQGEGGSMGERKRGLADFALWKAAKPNEPAWDSPWGPGRPGWHIECSAMSKKLLGPTFDIHGGGLDLVFPHHENEIAQSECCHHQPMVTYWAHNGLLRAAAAAGKVGGRSERAAEAPATARAAVPTDEASGKMSRSKGAGGLAELIARQSGERIRFFLLRTHYRSTVLFNEPAIQEAGTGLESFYRFFKRYQRITGNSFFDICPPTSRATGGVEASASALHQEITTSRDKFLAAMDDDFNTGGAIGELFELLRKLNKYCDENSLEDSQPQPALLESFHQGATVLRELTSILGIFGQPPATGGAADDQLLGQLLQLLIDLRAAARANQDFATADTIRDRLAPLGIVLEDRAGGTDWSGGDAESVEGLLQLLIELRQTARAAKDFATSDTIRDRLATAGILLEDRAGGTEWSRTPTS